MSLSTPMSIVLCTLITLLHVIGVHLDRAIPLSSVLNGKINQKSTPYASSSNIHGHNNPPAWSTNTNSEDSWSAGPVDMNGQRLSDMPPGPGSFIAESPDYVNTPSSDNFDPDPSPNTNSPFGARNQVAASNRNRNYASSNSNMNNDESPDYGSGPSNDGSYDPGYGSNFGPSFGGSSTPSSGMNDDDMFGSQPDFGPPSPKGMQLTQGFGGRSLIPANSQPDEIESPRSSMSSSTGGADFNDDYNSGNGDSYNNDPSPISMNKNSKPRQNNGPSMSMANDGSNNNGDRPPRYEYKYDIPKDSFQAEVVNGQFGSFANLPNSFESLIKSDATFLDKMSTTMGGRDDRNNNNDDNIGHSEPRRPKSAFNMPDEDLSPISGLNNGNMRPSAAGSTIDKESSSPDYYDGPMTSNFDDSFGGFGGYNGDSGLQEQAATDKPRRDNDNGPMFGANFHSTRINSPRPKPQSHSFSGNSNTNGPYSSAGSLPHSSLSRPKHHAGAPPQSHINSQFFQPMQTHSQPMSHHHPSMNNYDTAYASFPTHPIHEPSRGPAMAASGLRALQPMASMKDMVEKYHTTTPPPPPVGKTLAFTLNWSKMPPAPPTTKKPHHPGYSHSKYYKTTTPPPPPGKNLAISLNVANIPPPPPPTKLPHHQKSWAHKRARRSSIVNAEMTAINASTTINTKSKVVKNRNMTTIDSNIMPTKLSIETLFSNCVQHENFCEMYDHYPSQEIARLWNSSFTERFAFILNSSSPYNNSSRYISSFGNKNNGTKFSQNDQRKCIERRKILRPLRARNTFGIWRLVVNVKGHVQQDVELVNCDSLAIECNNSNQTGRGKCGQEYSTKMKLVVYDQRQKSFDIDSFDVPIGCICLSPEPLGKHTL